MQTTFVRAFQGFTPPACNTTLTLRLNWFRFVRQRTTLWEEFGPISKLARLCLVCTPQAKRLELEFTEQTVWQVIRCWRAWCLEREQEGKCVMNSHHRIVQIFLIWLIQTAQCGCR